MSRLAKFLVLLGCFTLGACDISSSVEETAAARVPAEDSSEFITWRLSVAALDDIDRYDKVDIPLEEAIQFIEDRSKIRFDVSVVESDLAHSYTNYGCASPPCVIVNASDLDAALISALPVSDAYLLLWNFDGRTPLQAGSTWGVADGILKGGLRRPYATLGVDIWWYNNSYFEGFSGRGAQILTHELINTINAKIEVAPYFCDSLVGTTPYAKTYEQERLEKLTNECYLKLDPSFAP
jgi:hypothetical protein